MTPITFFDLDHTLIDGDSDFSFVRFLVERGELDDSLLARVDELDEAYVAGRPIDAEYVAFLGDVYRGRSEASLRQIAVEHARTRVAAMRYPGARALVDRERRLGRTLLLLSTTNDVVTRPVAAELGLDGCLSTVLATEGDRLTGELAGPLCHGPGKAERLREACEARGVDPRTCRMYGDGRSDMEALELVGEPVAVHPHDALAARARERGWRSIRLDDVRAARLREVVRETHARLACLEPARRRERPRPGGWSPIELVGHLVDSASNNHQRFVRAPHEGHLDFAGYDQDAWVHSQRYAHADWDDLLVLWRTFNEHIAHVMESTPIEAQERPLARHSLDRIAFDPRPAGEPVTVGWFMDDYIDHLEHHARAVPRS